MPSLWRSDEAGRWAVTAVADGHGHALAVRAERGSRLAVDVAVDAAQALSEALRDEPASLHSSAVTEGLPVAITNGWLASVHEDLDADPLSSLELERSGNVEALATNQALAYGTTLIVSLAAAGFVVACQIGDGDLIGVSGDGTVFPALANRRPARGHPDDIACFAQRLH